MKNFVYISVVFFLFSCATSYKIGSEGEKYKLPKELVLFLNSFEQSVTSHDTNKLLQNMDIGYKKDQLNGFLGGKTEPFINEFFCGENVATGTFKCLNFNEISGIYFSSIQKKDSTYTVYYSVSSKKITVDCSWDISVTKNNGKTVYGLVGAVG